MPNRFKMKLILALLLLTSTAVYGQISITLTPNGSDDYTAIQSAVKAGGGKQVNVIWKPGLYWTSRYIDLPYSNVRFFSDTSLTELRPTPDFKVTRDGLFQAKAPAVYTDGTPTASLNIQVRANSNQFVYTDADKLKIGQVLVLSGGENFAVEKDAHGLPYKHGWFGSPIAIEGNVITMNNTPREGFTAYGLTQYGSLHDIQISGLKINLAGWTTGYGLEFRFVTNCKVDGIVIEGTPNSAEGHLMGIMATADGMVVQNSSFRHQRYLAKSGGNYAVNLQGNDLLVYNCNFWQTVDGIESGGRNYVTRGYRILKNRISDLGRLAIGMHANTYGEVAYNIIYTKWTQAITFRHKWSRAHHNYILVDNTAGTQKFNNWLWEYAFDGMQIDSNWFVYRGGTAKVNLAIKTSQLLEPMRNMKVFNNNIWGGSFSFSNLGTGNFISDNHFYEYGGIVGFLRPKSLEGNTISDNRFIKGIAPPDESVLQEAWNKNPFRLGQRKD